MSSRSRRPSFGEIDSSVEVLPGAQETFGSRRRLHHRAHQNNTGGGCGVMPEEIPDCGSTKHRRRLLRPEHVQRARSQRSDRSHGPRRVPCPQSRTCKDARLPASRNGRRIVIPCHVRSDRRTINRHHTAGSCERGDCEFSAQEKHYPQMPTSSGNAIASPVTRIAARINVANPALLSALATKADPTRESSVMSTARIAAVW
jgi:hypothetical protein